MKKVILIGMKGCGKTTVGKLLSQKLAIPFVELDHEIEKKHQSLKNESLSSREIFRKYGKKYFRELETNTLLEISKTLENKEFVFACGGGTPLKNKNRKLIKRLGINIFLNVNQKVLLERILKNGIPSFFPYPNNPKRSLAELLKKRIPCYQKIAQSTLSLNKETPEEIVEMIIRKLQL